MVDFKIYSLKIEGFKDKDKRIYVEFSDKQTTAIYGKNGSGKTTLLKIINAIFNRDTRTLYKEKVSKIDIVFEMYGKKHEVNLKLMKTLEKMDDYDFFNIDYNWDAMDFVYENILLISTDRGLSDYRRKIDIKDIHSYLQNINDEIVLSKDSSYLELSNFIEFLNGETEQLKAEELFQKQNVYIDNMKMDAIENICIKKYKEIEALKNNKIKLIIYQQIVEMLLNGNGKKNKVNKFKINDFEYIDNLNVKIKEYQSIINDIFISTEEKSMEPLLISILKSNNDDFSKIVSSDKKNFSFEQSIEYMKKIVDILDSYKDELFALDNIEKVFTKFSNGKKLFIDEDEIYVEVKSQKHNISELSNGEKHLLTFLVILQFIGKTKSIIMIDEPGISLDTEWQEELVEMMEFICPNSQIILTTHSPDIAMNDPDIMKDLVVWYAGDREYEWKKNNVKERNS